MPLEIRELIIKANLGNGESESGVAASGRDQQSTQQTDVQACVEAVLEILKERQER